MKRAGVLLLCAAWASAAAASGGSPPVSFSAINCTGIHGTGMKVVIRYDNVDESYHGLFFSRTLHYNGAFYGNLRCEDRGAGVCRVKVTAENGVMATEDVATGQAVDVRWQEGGDRKQLSLDLLDRPGRLCARSLGRRPLGGARDGYRFNGGSTRKPGGARSEYRKNQQERRGLYRTERF